MAIDPKKPATLSDLYTLLNTYSRGVGILTALAVKHGAPENFDAFINAVQLAELELANSEPDVSTFFEVAYDGIETVMYDLDLSND